MELSFDGNPLLFDNNDKIQEFLVQYQRTRQTDQAVPITDVDDRRSSVSEAKVALPTPNYPPVPALRINQLYWPTGATRWGRIYCLADHVTSGFIEPLVSAAEPKTLKVSFGIGQEFQMYALPLIRVSSMESDALWLVPLVDARWTWQYRDVGNITTTELETWTALFTHLATQLGYSFGSDFDIDVPDADYLKPHQVEFLRPYENAATMLEAAAHSVGRRVIFRQDGQVVVTNSDTAKADLDNNISGPSPATPWCQIAGGDITPNMLPEKVVVTFPDPRGCKDPYVVTNSTITTSGKIPGTFKTLHSAAFANFESGAETPSNDTELDALAELIAIDWASWEDKRYDHTYVGLKEWTLTGFDDNILYDFGGTQKPDVRVSIDPDGEADGRLEVSRDPLMTTRITGVPFNFGVSEQIQGSSLDVPNIKPGDTLVATTTTVIPPATAVGPGQGSADIYELKEDGTYNDVPIITSETIDNTTGDQINSGITGVVLTVNRNCRLIVVVEPCTSAPAIIPQMSAMAPPVSQPMAPIVNPITGGMTAPVQSSP